jgi:hypothetical protein
MVFLDRAFAAGETAMDFGSAEFDEFGFNPFLFNFLQYIAKQDGCVSALSGAAVQGNNFDA